MDARKVAVITGSGSGVGAATALQLAQQGWNVVINYSRSQDEAREVEAQCRTAGAETLLVKADVGEDSQCLALVAAAADRWGRIDTLVNNAGVSVFGDAAKWDALDPAVFDRVMRVNVTGAFQMSRAALPQLKAAKGSIVNVSSVAGVLGIGSSLPYIASKGALNSMTLHLARQLAPDVRVNAVCPGLITSRWFARGMGEAAAEKGRQAYEAEVPLERACSPEDVAQAVIYLMQARTVTGELLLLDSGRHLGRRPGR